MIKAQELRLGNLFQYCGNSYECLGALQLMTYYQPKEDIGQRLAYYTDIKPIPLTEEWLLKFGFEKRTGKYIGNCWAFGINPRTEDYLIALEQINENQDFFYQNSFFDIKSVHQLQNLYFALTGEELSIVETVGS